MVSEVGHQASSFKPGLPICCKGDARHSEGRDREATPEVSEGPGAARVPLHETNGSADRQVEPRRATKEGKIDHEEQRAKW